MNTRLSIVITCYNRAGLLKNTLMHLFAGNVFAISAIEIIVVEDGWDNGKTEGVAKGWGAEYLCRKNRPDVPYSNPAIPNNIGIKAAHGEFIILQNAECKHLDLEKISTLLAPIYKDPMVATYATVAALNQQGEFAEWYVHPTESPRPYFFCGAIRREHLLALGGFEESFKSYGYDDNDMAYRLTKYGVRHVFTDVLVHHQWHPRGDTDPGALEEGRKLFDERVRKMDAGELSLVANQGKEWGRLDS